MLTTFASLLLTASALPVPPQCSSFATLSAADQKQYGSRYRFRVRTKGKAVAEEWIRKTACPEARAAIRAKRGAPPTDKNGRPCAKTRTEMRPISSDGSMTMIPRKVCVK
jgi:ribosomal protein L37AE/L43A